MERDIETLIDDLRTAQDQDELKQAFSRALAGHGLDAFTYVGISLPRSGSNTPVICTTYPDDWVRHYIKNSYQDVDPVALAATGTPLPYDWSTVAATGKRARRVMDEARSVGLVNGLSIPVHGFASEFALISIASPLSTREYGELLRHARHRIHIMAMHYHAVLHDLLARQAGADQTGITLTRREREVLTWTAQGKTAWEISEILKISESTVVFHVQNAKRKLGVFARSHAVAKAIHLGLLCP